MGSANKVELSKCLIHSNCILVEWEFDNINEKYEKLIEIASKLPRTKEIERTRDYWHGVCRSLIFRFPDDLEILRLKRKNSRTIIQVKSASKFGASDLGVNRKRINSLYKDLMQ